MSLLKEIALMELYCDEIEWEIDQDLEGIDLTESDWVDIYNSIDSMNLFDSGAVLDESESTLSETAKQAVKKVGRIIKRWYRCSGGPKDGKLVNDPSACTKRKDPAKVRQGRKTAMTNRGMRVAKTKIAKKQSISKLVTKMNQRLGGK